MATNFSAKRHDKSNTKTCCFEATNIYWDSEYIRNHGSITGNRSGIYDLGSDDRRMYRTSTQDIRLLEIESTAKSRHVSCDKWNGQRNNHLYDITIIPERGCA